MTHHTNGPHGIALAALAVLACVLAAQAGAANGGSSSSSSSIDAKSSPAQAENDSRMFVRRAFADGGREVRDAQDALMRVKRPEVRNAAQMIIDDHTKVNDRLAALAMRKGWEYQDGARSAPPPVAAATATGVTAANVDVDTLYVDQQVAAHQTAIASFSQQAGLGDDADVREFAAEILPTLRTHLDELRKLQKPPQ